MANDYTALENDRNSHLDDDDEVVDLLEVVKPGKKLEKAGSEDEDFSADLEAMLDSLSEAQAALDDTEQGEDVKPFPDPTPVDHTVDPDESLDLPDMDDIDDILKSLGADSTPAADDEPEDFEASAENDMPDLDALPVTEPPEKKPEAVAKPEEDDFFDSLFADTAEKPQGTDTSANDKDDEETLDEDAVAAMMAELGLGGKDDADEQDAVEEKTVSPEPEKEAERKVAIDADDLLAELGLSDTGAQEENASLAEISENLDTLDTGDEVGAVEAHVSAPQAPSGSDAVEGPTEQQSKPLPTPTVLVGVRMAQSEQFEPETTAEEMLETPKNIAASSGEEEGQNVTQDTPIESQATPDNDHEGAAASSQPRYDEVDLNELDALLDDVLASAPPSGSAGTSGKPDVVKDSDASEAEPEQPVEQATVANSAVTDQLQELEESLAKIREELSGFSDETRAALAGLRQEFDAEKNKLKEPGPEQQERFAKLEEMLDGHAGKLTSFAARLEDAELTLTALDTRIDDVEKQLADMHTNLEKMAAEAAAKVIREELAALLQAEAEE